MKQNACKKYKGFTGRFVLVKRLMHNGAVSSELCIESRYVKQNLTETENRQ